LLRTAVALSYLWEASFLTKALEALRLANAGDRESAREQLQAFLTVATEPLIRIEGPDLPPSQKNVAPAVRGLLARGEEAREILSGIEVPEDNHEVSSVTSSLLNITVKDDLEAPEHRKVPKNLYEFIRYLLLARGIESGDQSDFYYLARTDGRNLWIEPGPEWLVVVASLCATKPGTDCTVREVLQDLRTMGVRIERRVLVMLLERAGLTTDSPDADDALVVQSAF
jgi:hypothetical protein